VLEQMREARAAGAFIQRTHVVPEIDSYKRQAVIFVRDDGEAVRQRVFVILDLRQLVSALRMGGNAGDGKD
jgi:hypothetical protein